DEPCAVGTEDANGGRDPRQFPQEPGGGGGQVEHLHAERLRPPHARLAEPPPASHQGTIKGQDDGFFKVIVLPFAGVDHDTIPRRDTSAEKLAALKPAFDHSAAGTLTAGNSSPNTDGASSIWVGDAEGLKKLGVAPTVRLVDWEITAMDFRKSEEGILMAPGRAIPRLLARNNLKFMDFALWEI